MFINDPNFLIMPSYREQPLSRWPFAQDRALRRARGVYSHHLVANKGGAATRSLYLAQSKGYILSQQLYALLAEEVGGLQHRPLVYIELLGTEVYLLRFDEQGCVSHEEILKLCIREGDIDRERIELLSQTMTQLVGEGKPRVLYAEAADTITGALATLEEHQDHALSDYKNNLKRTMNAIEGCPLVLNKSDDENEPSLSLCIGTEHISDDWFCTAIPSRTAFLTAFNLSAWQQLPPTMPTVPIDEFLAKATRRYIRNSVGVSLALATLFGQSWYQRHQDKKAQLARVQYIVNEIDNWEQYNEILTRTGVNAHMGMVSLSVNLDTLERLLAEINWGVYDFSVDRNILTVTTLPITSNASLKELTTLASSNGIQLLLSDVTSVEQGENPNAVTLATHIHHYAIQPDREDVYLTSIPSEISYLTDAFNFMMYEGGVVPGQRVSERYWASSLVNINFKCWLPLDFALFASQLIERNYGLRAIEAASATSVGSDDSLAPLRDACGFNGHVTLEVFGDSLQLNTDQQG
ncbi:hypothetical protein [Aliagarivorans taiwanensis]|uniref:hypothetical protein n=1 Tax=Aliagarivorans taiwanensis TaxID=561966 RepID=UPI000400EA96|nr:hypothetical protein [Aliagarivorans taiwanensis]